MVCFEEDRDIGEPFVVVFKVSGIEGSRSLKRRSATKPLIRDPGRE